MTIKVQTKWKGKVAVADHKVQKAVLEGEDLVIIHNGQIMKIENDDIQERIDGRSGLFEDRYGRDPYRLLYFEWSPTSGKQGKLI